MPYGYYRFDLNFADPACPSGGSYIIEVTAPAAGYIAGPSQIIPPASDATTSAVLRARVSGERRRRHHGDRAALRSADLGARAAGVGARAQRRARAITSIFTFDDSLVPGSAQIFNNHIPLDPDLQGVLSLSKTTPMMNVTRGQLVPYTITYTNVTPVPLFDVALVDRFPAGFRYIEGSARIDGVPAEPTLVGRELRWNDLSVDGNARHRSCCCSPSAPA